MGLPPEGQRTVKCVDCDCEVKMLAEYRYIEKPFTEKSAIVWPLCPDCYRARIEGKKKGGSS